MSTAPLLTAACLASVAALIVVDRLGWSFARAAAKLAASSCFVLVAVALGAAGSPYGRLILGALALGWLGDALLLSQRPAAFLAGLGAFLLAHLLFAAAFLLGPVAPGPMAAASALALAVAFFVLRWLRPHVPPGFRGPVVAYVVAILAMCVAAAGSAHATGRWLVVGGAVLFAASDLSVARDRFVRAGHVNRLWGWPAYFVAQLLLAWSVAA